MKKRLFVKLKTKKINFCYIRTCTCHGVARHDHSSSISTLILGIFLGKFFNLFQTQNFTVFGVFFTLNKNRIYSVKFTLVFLSVVYTLKTLFFKCIVYT